MNHLLGENPAVTKATFTADQATTYFQDVFSKPSESFEAPEWLPTPKRAETLFATCSFTMDEIASRIKRGRLSSKPCPFDQVSYYILKRCPSLLPALHHLYNKVWHTQIIPASWQHAAITLIPKESALSDSSSPKNFRPIALTSCIGNIFTAMVKGRWDSYLLTNGLLNTTVQKAFQPKTSGCEEHHQKLWSVLQDANSNQRSLAIAWIDLENAYGSVPHGLIDFALKYYHAPNKLTTCIQKLYSNLWASILTPSWSSNPIRMSIGVFQGDPLSSSIFNCVIGTLVDTLQYHSHHLGYRLSLSAQVISQLQFADDTCIMARNPQCCQEMLRVINRWLLWSTMKAKPSKCQAITLRSRCSAETRVYDPDLIIGNAPIPTHNSNQSRFLACLSQPHCQLSTIGMHWSGRQIADAEDRRGPPLRQAEGKNLPLCPASKDVLGPETVSSAPILHPEVSRSCLHSVLEEVAQATPMWKPRCAVPRARQGWPWPTIHGNLSLGPVSREVGKTCPLPGSSSEQTGHQI